MTEANADEEIQADEPAAPRVQRDRLDNILNATLGGLLAAVLLFSGYFAWNVWTVRQAQIQASPALRLLESVKEEVRQDPNSAQLRVRLGEAYGAANQYGKAIEQLENALKIDPEHTGAYLDLGIIGLLQEDTAAAARYFEKVVELTEGLEFSDVNERRELALFNLGRISLANNEYEDAIGYFKGALRIRKDASDTYLYLARAYEGLEEFDAALGQLQIAVAFDPNYAEARYLMGTLFLEIDDQVNAARNFKYAADLAPDIEPVIQALESFGTSQERMDRAAAAIEAGDSAMALEHAAIAAALDPESMDAALLYGKLLMEKKSYTDAVVVYTAALEIDPENAEAKSGLEKAENAAK